MRNTRSVQNSAFKIVKPKCSWKSVCVIFYWHQCSFYVSRWYGLNQWEKRHAHNVKMRQMNPSQCAVLATFWYCRKCRLRCQKLFNHDDVIKWKHFPRYWPFVRGIHRSPVNSPHKGQWRGALMFTLICARINDWVNNREAGDLRRYRTHYDVIVMSLWPSDSYLRQAIIWTNAGISLTKPLRINCSDLLIEIHIFSFNETIVCEMAAILSRPQCVKWISFKPRFYPIQAVKTNDLPLPLSFFMRYWATLRVITIFDCIPFITLSTMRKRVQKAGLVHHRIESHLMTRTKCLTGPCFNEILCT